MASANVDETALQVALESVIRANRALARAGSLDEVLQAIVDNVVGANIDHSSLWLVHSAQADDPQTLELAAEWNRAANTAGLIGDRLPPEAILRAVSDGNSANAAAALYFSDLSQDNGRQFPPQLKTFLVDKRHLRSLALLPLVAGEQYLGVLLLASRQTGNWPPSQQSIYLAILDHVAGVVRNLQPARQGSASPLTALTDVERSLNELHILLDISRELSSSLDTEAVYKSAVQAFMATGADSCALAIVDSYQGAEPTWSEVVVLVNRHDTDAYLNHLGRRHHLADYPALMRLVTAHTPVIVHDLSTECELDENERQVLLEANIQALVVLPLVSEGQAIGYIWAARRAPYRFEDREIDLYRTIVNQITIAIEHAWQMDEMRHRTTQLTTAAEVSQLASSILNPDELLEKVVTIIRDRFDVYYVGLFLVEEIGEEHEPYAVLKAGTGEAGQVQLEAGHKLRVDDNSMVGGCIVAGSPRVNLDVKEGAVRFVNPHLPETRSEIALPLSSRGRIIGALTVQSVQKGAFGDEDIRVLQTMAEQVAIAIDNADLFTTVNLALEETNTLYTISRRIAAAQTSKQVADVIVDAVPKRSYDHVILTLKDDPHDPESTWIEVTSGWDRVSPPEDFLGNRYSSQMAPALTSSQANEIVVEPDVANSRSLDSQTRRFLTGLGIRSTVMVPLSAGERLLGWLVAGTVEQPRSFSENDIRFLQLLADQAGISLGRLQAIESLLESREQYLTVVDNIPGAVYRRLPDENYTMYYINEEIQALTGYEPEVFGPNNEVAFADLIHPDDRAHYADAIANQVSAQQPYEIEYRLIDRFGDTRYVLERGRGVFNEKAQLTYLDGIIFDISDRRTLELALQRRAIQLESAAEVGHIASSILDVDRLINRAVELIRERFNLYYVGLFLVDETEQWAVLQAGTGQAGQIQVTEGHRLAIGSESMIGSCLAVGAPRLVDNINQAREFFANPHLPDTRSELALPLHSRGDIIGALTVQSEKEAAFSQEDVDALQLMANLLANTIVNARLFSEVQRNFEEQSLLKEVTTAASTTFDHTEFLTEVARRVVEHYNIDHCGIVLYNSTQTVMTVEAEYPASGALGAQLPARGYPAGDQFLAEREPLVISDILNGTAMGEVTPVFQAMSINTVALIPIILENRLIGSMGLDVSDPAYVFSDSDLALAGAIAAQVAISIEKVRLFEETQITLEDTAALYRVTRALTQIDDEREMFELVLAEYLQQLGLQQGGVLLFDDDGAYGTLRAHKVAGKFVEPGLRIPVAGNPSYEQLIETREPVIIDDVFHDERLEPVRDLTIELGIKSILFVPIIVRGTVIGALGADATEAFHEFTPREVSLVQGMADQLGIALENRRLLAKTQRLALQLQTGADVGRVITSNLDLDVLLGETVELIRDRFGFDHAQIFLLDEDGKWAVLHKSTGPVGRELLARGHKLPVGSQSVIGQVTARRQTLIARDVGSDLVHRPNVLLPDTRAEIAIPLQIGNKLIGALDVQSNESDAFSENDVVTLELLAAQIAVAIENARAFAEQQESAARLRELDRMKTQFLANMSHELRTPLNSIIGFSRVILKGIDGPITELQKSDLTAIYNSGQHLLGLINNILDLSKIEAGKFELNFEEVDLGQVIKVVMSTAVALVKDKDVELIQHVPDELPRIYADQTRIRQVILNLIANAAKFTREGSITLMVRVEGDYLVLHVKDTGVGIPADKLDHIFEEFTQVDASTTRRAGGTGLGLPITRRLVEMHHGTISVKSKEGSGTVFTVRLPLNGETDEAAPAVTPVEPSPEETRDRIILVVDNDEGVATLYQRYLHTHNFHIIPLTDSSDVVAQTKKTEPYAILLDILMPGKDGWTVLRELKGDPQTRDIPVIIASIVAAEDRGLSLGAVDYLRKPIMESELRDALSTLESSTKDHRRVLVIDDKADDILLVRRVLEAHGNYHIIEASDGATGLDLVRRKRPDLIILDLMMPEMDGFAVVESLKANVKTRSIPIIVVTAKDTTPEEQRVLEAQVEATLQKGIFSEDELVAEVSKVLDRISVGQRG